MLELEGQGKQTVIEFYDIEEFSLKIDSFNNGFSKCLTWGYEEWEVVSCKPRKFRLSVLCDIEKEFSFIFKNATIVEPKTGDGLKPLKKWVF